MKAPRKHEKILHGNPLLAERVHDTYRDRGKRPEPARCGGCGAIYRKGRWQWLEEIPDDALDSPCPACRRVADGYPAGEVIVSGGFAKAHVDELLRLIRNTEEVENGEHPLHRIINICQEDDGIRVTTTDLHLPRRIGHALEAAWDGKLVTHYDDGGAFVRVMWRREV